VSDYDNDGDMDVLITDLGEGVRLLRNDMQTGNWIKVRLRSRLQNGKALGFGDGAKVIAHLGKVGLRRTVSSVSYLSQSSRTLHFGLGNAIAIDRLEVRWLGGRTNNFTNLQANATWEVTEDETVPRRLERKMLGPRPDLAARMPSTDERTRLVEFWEKQRAAMNAMKVEKDLSRATALFQQALKLDPKHEDSRYYLAHCLSAQGDINSALTELEVLQRINSHSHRAFQQWGCLRALSAVSDSDLAAAEKALEQAHTLNPEETGALLLLGEISLLRGDKPKAKGRFSAACRSNPRAVAGFFLQGYLAWKGGNTSLAQEFLTQTRQALGPDWQPRGATSEGDVERKHHTERSPLARHWECWDGVAEPARAYASLDKFLSGREIH
jgi:tetratricopeptide (TPR) repeat protein